MSDTSGSVTVTLLNSNGAPTAYLTQQNTMTLSIANQTLSTLVVEPSAPQNPPPTGGEFGVVLYFDAFYTDAGDASQLAITAVGGGWEAQYFGDGDFPGWVVTATEEHEWDVGAALAFTVSGFEPTVPVGTDYLAVSLYNLAGLPPQPYSVVVGVSNPPSVQNKELYTTVALSLDSKDVEITKNPDEPVENGYQLTLMNTNPNAALVPSGTAWSNVKFTLSFAYASEAPGYFALTTPDAADAFQVGIAQDPASGWNAPVKKDGPVWEITPKAGNQSILGTGIASAVVFSIDQVVTQLIPGTTQLYLQYNDIPGYNDGFLTLVLNKEYPEMKIVSFSAGQVSFPAAYPGSATAYVNWEVDYSMLVQIDGVGQVASKGSELPITLDASRTVLLTAYDSVLGEVAARSLSFQVTPPLPGRWLPCGSIIAWEGAVDTIPVNWQLCDGTNGTPDLRDRFVMGATSQEPPGSSGAPTHTHVLTGFSTSSETGSAGNHIHGMPTNWYARKFTSGGKTSIDTDGSYDPDTQTQQSGFHTHTLPVSFASISTEANQGSLRPKWYALCYIMLLTPS